jgi:pyruvate dehydrogenase E2 component (dihydrolipoamide acetyltransferase)
MLDAMSASAEQQATQVVDVKMPRLSDSMEEATILQWLKQQGDSVKRGEPLVEVETDKATMVYEAEFAGVLEEIVVADGETAALGAVIARASTAGSAAAAPPPPAPAEPKPAEASPAETPPAEAPAAPRAASGFDGKRARATPVARRVASQLGVALDGLEGTGPGGRIVRADVRAAAGRAEPAPEAAPAATPLTATQRTIAQRMSESRGEIPEFTLEAEIDMERAVAMRDELREAGREPLPSLNDFVVRAVALALREFPGLNSSYADGALLRHPGINVGIAVATDDALLVPTIADTDRKSVFEIATEARALIRRVQERKADPATLSGGTFTVSNLGMFGVRRFQAVINPPQAAILAVGEVARRPAVAPDGTIVARQQMDISLSVDHRIVYGAEAGRFLQRLKLLLEHPTLLILD